ncbi:helix-turn-helix domain-containing protein [Hymenobacter edaphi]|uniref:AraC family transcriptional regulator n=1 Tax=Hymenobacter edaphi TaxID=2211146 RepID=A0A328BUC5_9BACT|nr:AraC family transcriptional regulator [Hymenobacter edaphi]RAK70219.1 AraC family transcriptional regulator [Hymenobacter edaphi]
MLLENLPPAADLAAYVKQYRIADFSFAGGQPPPFKAYPPRVQECLQFYPKDPEQVVLPQSGRRCPQTRVALTGQPTVVSNRHIGQNFLTLQVVFQPGQLFLLTGIPAQQLVNGYLDAEAVLGAEVARVNEQLATAASYPQMLSVVEQYLRQLVRRARGKPHPIDRIGRLMGQYPDKYPLEWFAREACLSYRQFDRKFKERMGVGPKLYRRIIRFDQAFRRKNQAPEQDWLSIALHCGYHDYQHLAKDYAAFTGHSPAAFYAIETRAPERYFGEWEV